MRVGIVADDLTGAMDASAPFAGHGFATRVLLSVENQVGTSAAAQVLAIDTHSRELSGADAASVVQAAVARIGSDGLPFKKIDSTLRGPIAAEIAAALQASGRHCALVAPAAPAQGRVLREGRLFVNGQQVGARSVVDMLRAAMPGVPVRLLGAGGPATDERCVLVADGESEQDLTRVAALGLDHPDSVLLVGSSGLAAALADAMRPAQTMCPSPKYERLIIAVGSYNSRSAEQVRTLLAHRSVRSVVLTLQGELRRSPLRSNSAVVLLHVEGLDAPPMLDPRQVATSLADATADLLAEQGEARTALFMTGGDTARAILSRLQVADIDVIGNLYAGVVHGRATVAGRQLGVITKAGGFGGVAVLLKATADLVAESY